MTQTTESTQNTQTMTQKTETPQAAETTQTSQTSQNTPSVLTKVPAEELIRFNNDYNHGAHPSILEALLCTNDESFPGYGTDLWCDRAQELIREAAQAPKAQVHFVTGGTQANFTVISAALRPWESVISADTGHIHAHETGAVEHIGHKIETLPAVDGKITAQQIEGLAVSYELSDVPEHITQPKMVYLSYSTEFGTLYSRAELEAIAQVCKDYGLYLFVDGARMGYGLGSAEADLTLADFARLCDVFTIGGTKCGALFGEAVVLTNLDLFGEFYFRNNIKQNGGMLAKGWLLGLQFATLFENNLYFEITRRADEQAMRLRDAFREAGVPFYIESPTNQQFVVLHKRVLQELSKKYTFENEGTVDEAHGIARFCTSWATKDEEVDELIADIQLLAKAGML